MSGLAPINMIAAVHPIRTVRAVGVVPPGGGLLILNGGHWPERPYPSPVARRALDRHPPALCGGVGIGGRHAASACGRYVAIKVRTLPTVARLGSRPARSCGMNVVSFTASRPKRLSAI